MPAGAFAADDFKLNTQEYFERPGIIRPDFPELKHRPFFWQQTEYVLGRGTMDYLLLVLAADHVLNQ